MRDLKLFYTDSLGFDIEMDKRGYPTQVGDGQTNDQRAALAVAIERSSIPCATDIGIDWGLVYNWDTGNSLADLKQQCEEFIEKCAGQVNGATYTPLFEMSDGGQITVRTVRIGKE